MDVLFSMEYKPKVAQNLGDEPACHISEVFLQAFYIATQVEHNVMHCLTDLVDYHLFLIGKENGKLCIKKYWYHKCKLTDSGKAATLLQFLAEKIPVPSCYTSPVSGCAAVTRPDTDIGDVRTRP